MQENLREGKKSYLADSLQVCLTCTAQLTGNVALLMNIEQLNGINLFLQEQIDSKYSYATIQTASETIESPFRKNVKKSVRIAEGRVSK